MGALEVFNQVLGPASGCLLVWILIKLTRVETKVERIASHELQLRDHEVRLSKTEDSTKRAHERCNDHKQQFKDLEKREAST